MRRHASAVWSGSRILTRTMNESHESRMIFLSRWRSGAFWATFVVVFFVSFALLDVAGFTPNSSHASTEASNDPSQESNTPAAPAEEPVRIIADSIGLNETIVNPTSTDIPTLDAALRDGVVRYPGSALVGESANMFLFGHSSYLPVVYNSNYKAFNNIQKLAIGDEIRIQSRSTESRYKVTSVKLVEADKALVEFSPGIKKLTLSTCNSFGAKGERFVVEAEFVGSRSL